MPPSVAANPGPAEDQQRALYGESWADRLGRLMAAYRLSQARLAAVIGLSAPMLSQLVTGHRVKITNPSVFGRIVRLEQLQTDPRVTGGDAMAIAGVLEEVAASSPVLTTMTTQVRTVSDSVSDSVGDSLGDSVGDSGSAETSDEQAAVRHLSSLAEPVPLAAAAVAAEAAGGAGLARLLRQALPARDRPAGGHLTT